VHNCALGAGDPIFQRRRRYHPPFITGYAADEWWRTGPELHRLGLLTAVDVTALAAYCYSHGQWRMAAESFAKLKTNDPIMNGMIIKTKYGDAATNPLVSIVRKHASDVMRYASEFGLTPVARTRLAAAATRRLRPAGSMGCCVNPNPRRPVSPKFIVSALMRIADSTQTSREVRKGPEAVYEASINPRSAKGRHGDNLI